MFNLIKGLRQKGVHPPVFAPKRGTPRKRLNEATVPPGRLLFPVIRVSRRCKTQQGMRENLWVSTVGAPCLLSLCGVGAIKRVYHEGRIRVDKLNTTVLQGLDSPDIVYYYCTDQNNISAVANTSTAKRFDREEAALQFVWC